MPFPRAIEQKGLSEVDAESSYLKYFIRKIDGRCVLGWKKPFLGFFSFSNLLTVVRTFQRFLKHITFPLYKKHSGAPLSLAYCIVKAAVIVFVLKYTFLLIHVWVFFRCFSFAVTIQSIFYLCNLFCRPICVYTAAEKLNMIPFPSKWKTKGHTVQNINEEVATGISLYIYISLWIPSTLCHSDDRFRNYPPKWAPSLSACDSSLCPWQGAVEGSPFYSWALIEEGIPAAVSDWYPYTF